jgi:NADH-quinone oxidoreductase subunit G
MADAPKLVSLTVDGKKLTAPAGSLLIEACKNSGHRSPFLLLLPRICLCSGACRMCLVRVEKMPKLQTACTTVVGEGMIGGRPTAKRSSRRAKRMVELLLGNHPLDCPVCDAGGECELQDMTFSATALPNRSSWRLRTIKMSSSGRR